MGFFHGFQASVPGRGCPGQCSVNLGNIGCNKGHWFLSSGRTWAQVHAGDVGHVREPGNLEMQAASVECFELGECCSIVAECFHRALVTLLVCLASCSKCNVVNEIAEIEQRLPFRLTWEHVRGHQDNKKNCCEN